MSSVQLVSAEGESFDVPIANAKMSTLIANLIDNQDAEDDEAQEIPLPNVKSTILSSVIEFMNHFATEPMNDIDKVGVDPLIHLDAVLAVLDHFEAFLLTHFTPFISSSTNCSIVAIEICQYG